MHDIFMQDHAPKQRDTRSASRRNASKLLIRSRGVQAVLVTAGLLQGVAAAAKHHGGATLGTPDPLAMAVTAPDLMPVLAQPVAAPALAEPAADTAPSEKDEAGRKAMALAAKYAKHGYRVTPSLAQDIHAAAVESGIDPEVAFGLVKAESSFKSSATSHVGAIGLTQLMPSTARWMEPGTTRSDLRDPETNLRIGFKYLAKLMDRYDGDTRLALTAYNRGPGTVDRVLRRGGDPDNGYADMVLRLRNR
ncbi:MAG TPA: lytic transglycosylase domain-containing protein [Longimicrobiaceae bacterium]|nr:lytic transglycosylase domain-containing protein [Longimicrobiaceae bacterium]